MPLGPDLGPNCLQRLSEFMTTLQANYRVVELTGDLH